MRLADHIVLWYVPCWLTSSANAGLHVGCGGPKCLVVEVTYASNVRVAVSIAKQPPLISQLHPGVKPRRSPPMVLANINSNCILSIQFGGYLAFLSIARYPPAPSQIGGYG